MGALVSVARAHVRGTPAHDGDMLGSVGEARPSTTVNRAQQPVTSAPVAVTAEHVRGRSSHDGGCYEHACELSERRSRGGALICAAPELRGRIVEPLYAILELRYGMKELTSPSALHASEMRRHLPSTPQHIRGSASLLLEVLRFASA